MEGSRASPSQDPQGQPVAANGSSQLPLPTGNVTQWHAALQEYCKNNYPAGTVAPVPSVPFYSMFGQPSGLSGLTLPLQLNNATQPELLPSVKVEDLVSKDIREEDPNSKRIKAILGGGMSPPMDGNVGPASKAAGQSHSVAVLAPAAPAPSTAVVATPKPVPPQGLQFQVPPSTATAGLPAALTLPTALHNMSSYWAAAAALSVAQQSQAAAAALSNSSGGGSPQADTDSKKLRRKQSNRESARRSRMRKQNETDQLSESCKALMHENEELKQQLASHKMVVDRLATDKSTLMQMVKELGGQVPVHMEVLTTK